MNEKFEKLPTLSPDELKDWIIEVRSELKKKHLPIKLTYVQKLQGILKDELSEDLKTDIHELIDELRDSLPIKDRAKVLGITFSSIDPEKAKRSRLEMAAKAQDESLASSNLKNAQNAHLRGTHLYEAMTNLRQFIGGPDEEYLVKEIQQLLYQLPKDINFIVPLQKKLSEYADTLNRDSDYDEVSQAEIFEDKYEKFIKEIGTLGEESLTPRINSFIEEISSELQLERLDEKPTPKEFSALEALLKAKLNAMAGSRDLPDVESHNRPLSQETEPLEEKGLTAALHGTHDDEEDLPAFKEAFAEEEGEAVDYALPMEEPYEESVASTDEEEGDVISTHDESNQHYSEEESIYFSDTSDESSDGIPVDEGQYDEKNLSEAGYDSEDEFSLPDAWQSPKPELKVIFEANSEMAKAFIDALNGIQDRAELVPILWRYHHLLGLEKQEIPQFAWSKILVKHKQLEDIVGNLKEIFIKKNPEFKDLLPLKELDLSQLVAMRQKASDEIDALKKNELFQQEISALQIMQSQFEFNSIHYQLCRKETQGLMLQQEKIGSDLKRVTDDFEGIENFFKTSNPSSIEEVELLIEKYKTLLERAQALRIEPLYLLDYDIESEDLNLLDEARSDVNEVLEDAKNLVENLNTQYQSTLLKSNENSPDKKNFPISHFIYLKEANSLKIRMQNETKFLEELNEEHKRILEKEHVLLTKNYLNKIAKKDITHLTKSYQTLAQKVLDSKKEYQSLVEDESSLALLEDAFKNAKMDLEEAQSLISGFEEKSKAIRVKQGEVSESLRYAFYNKEYKALLRQKKELSNLLDTANTMYEETSAAMWAFLETDGPVAKSHFNDYTQQFNQVSLKIKNQFTFNTFHIDEIDDHIFDEFETIKKEVEGTYDKVHALFEHLQAKLSELKSNYPDGTFGRKIHAKQIAQLESQCFDAKNELESVHTHLNQLQDKRLGLLNRELPDKVVQADIEALTQIYTQQLPLLDKARLSIETPFKSNQISEIEQQILRAEHVLAESQKTFNKLGSGDELENHAKSAREQDLPRLMKEIEDKEKILINLVKKIRGVNTNQGLGYYLLPGTNQELLNIIHHDLEVQQIKFLRGNGPAPEILTIRNKMLDQNPIYVDLCKNRSILALGQLNWFQRQRGLKQENIGAQIKALTDAYDDYIKQKLEMIKLDYDVQQAQKKIAHYEVFNAEKIRASIQIKGAQQLMDDLLKTASSDFDDVKNKCIKIEQYSDVCQKACQTATYATKGVLNPKTALNIIHEVHGATTFFNEVLVREGEFREIDKTLGINETSHVVSGSIGASSIQFKGVDLGKKDFIESTRAVSAPEIGILVLKQYGGGKVVDETKRPKNTQPHAKEWEKANEEIALEQAFKLLSNFEPGKKIAITPPHANKQQAKRLYAALLHLSASAGISLKQSDITVTVFDFERPISTFLFIRKNLPHSAHFLTQDAQLDAFKVALESLKEIRKRKDEAGKYKPLLENLESSEVVRTEPKSAG